MSSTQISVRVQIRRGSSKDDIFYVNDIKGMESFRIDHNPNVPG